VRLYSVGSDFAELRTLELPSKFYNLTFNPSGTKLAVGTFQPGNMVVYSSDNGWGDPPLRLGGNETGSFGTAFSHDGRLLCFGDGEKRSFLIWDVDAQVSIRNIQSAGYCNACAFSPADDLLALVSDNGIPVTLHELLSREPLATFSMPGNDTLPLSAACASAEVVVLASGTRLEAFDRADGMALWGTDLEETIFAHLRAMALQPTGGQVAVCMEQLKVVSVRDLQTGTELHRLKGGVCGVNYSPDGRLIMTYNGSNGENTSVYEATTGKELHSLQKGGWGGAFDPSNKLLVMTGPHDKTAVVNLESGEEAFTLDGGCAHGGTRVNSTGGIFNDAGDRMVYFLEGGDVVMWEIEGDTWRETRRWDISDKLNWAVVCQFSPGDGRFLLLVAMDEGDKAGHGRIVVLDSQTGEEPAWSECFRALMLPPGDFHRHNDNPAHAVRWVTPPPSQTIRADSSDSSAKDNNRLPRPGDR
jgi:WD40 repeat protein